jgi:hypothetical protein
VDVADTVAELLDWIRAAINELAGPDVERYSLDRWTYRWDSVVASAFHLGHSGIVDGLNEPFPRVSFPHDSPAAKAIRNRVRDRLVEVQRRLNIADTRYSALRDEDYHPPLDWHTTPEGRAVLADGFAQKLTSIADELEASNFRGLREHELRELAGGLIIQAYSRGFLRSLPHLGKFVAWHTASSENDPPVGEGGVEARRCRCPSNLFLDVIGGQSEIVRLCEDGTLEHIGPKPDDGILPAIDPALFERGDAIGACRFLVATISREATAIAESRVKKVDKEKFFALIRRRGLQPIASLGEIAWNLREWLREVMTDPALGNVMAVELPRIRRQLELALVDAELSRYAADLPDGENLSAAKIIAFIEGIDLPGGGRLMAPPGKPPEGGEWLSLSRVRALRIAMQLVGDDDAPLFDYQKSEDLDAIEGWGKDKLTAIWDAIERSFPLNDRTAAISPRPVKNDSPDRSKLNATQLAALEIIEKSSGPILGKNLAKQLDIEESSLRSHIIPKLKPFGVRNDRVGGYYVARSSVT